MYSVRIFHWRSLPNVSGPRCALLYSFLFPPRVHRVVTEPQALAEGGHVSHKAGLAAAGVPPSTNAFTDKATSLFIAAVSADCSASSLSTAPSAHLVWVRVNEVRVKVRI